MSKDYDDRLDVATGVADGASIHTQKWVNLLAANRQRVSDCPALHTFRDMPCEAVPFPAGQTTYQKLSLVARERAENNLQGIRDG